MLVYSFFMGALFMINLLVSMWCYFNKLDLVVEWVVFSFNSLMMEVFILVDWVSCLFISFVLIISSMVVIYSIEYMKGDKSLEVFTFLVVVFILSMLMVILSPSLISILFGWDMLGLVSYCLVIYYQNMSSFNSGMVTVLSNRLGDVGLLLAIGLLFMDGSWNLYLLGGQGTLLFYMILLASITKSAQMPFSSWLPMAMAAPTPVSSLVHSSTLVTAGVYLVIRFSEVIEGMKGGGGMLVFISVFTMFMSGLMANFEFDLKKIIALSTLSQLGLMMMTLGLGLGLLSFFHLLTHAIFKSLLFLCAGVMIHLMNGNQDIRCCGSGLGTKMPFVFVSLNISVLSLMGFPFFSGFYSKDLIMEVLYTLEVNMFLWVFMVISVSLTVMYSLRLCYYLNFTKVKMNSVSLSGASMMMNISMIILTFMSVMGGPVLLWMFFLELNLVYLPFMLKLMTIMMVILGGLMSVIWVKWGFKILMSFKSVVYYNSFMWLMNFVHVSWSSFFLMISKSFSLIDSEWIEVVEVNSWAKLKILITEMYYSEIKMVSVMFSMIMLMGFTYLLLFI